MLGDFNDWFWAGSVRKVLARALPGRTRHRTFPSICPLLHLDRIYCRPREALIRGYTDTAARAVSDHLPVIADVRLGFRVGTDESASTPGLLGSKRPRDEWNIPP
jgi:endonuclease/exonuclease/phosphatase family metal-dependent hydrolase